MLAQPILRTNNQNQQDSGDRISPYAVSLYNQASMQGTMSKVWARLTRRSNRLADLGELQSSIVIRGSRHGGIRPVPIEKIRGSEGRTKDFDAGFHPLNQLTRYRWQSIVMAAKRGIPLPPVELVQVGEDYFVRDGHHRISVAKALGQVDIDAQVTVLEVAQRHYSSKPAVSQTKISSILPAASSFACG